VVTVEANRPEILNLAEEREGENGVLQKRNRLCQNISYNLSFDVSYYAINFQKPQCNFKNDPNSLNHE
jgi:hypothetical protein